MLIYFLVEHHLLLGSFVPRIEDLIPNIWAAALFLELIHSCPLRIFITSTMARIPFLTRDPLSIARHSSVLVMLSQLTTQVLLLCSVATLARAQQSLYGQCGGIGQLGLPKTSFDNLKP